jgi:hypothetical protein
MGDLADFRVHTGGKDNRFGLARYHRGAGEQYVFAMNQLVFFRGTRVPCFRQRFASDARDVNPGIKGLDQPGIGRDIVALFQVSDFTLGTHPISTKRTTEIGGAKRRSDFELFTLILPLFSTLRIFSL